jgi:hypothetical protein
MNLANFINKIINTAAKAACRYMNIIKLV